MIGSLDPTQSTYAWAQPPPNQGLIQALEKGDLQTLKKFIEEGGDPNAKTSYGTPIIIVAARSGILATVIYLAEHGADLKATDPFGVSTLHNAVSHYDFDIVKYLVEHGADLNGITSRGDTALHYAISTRYPDCMKYLVEHGANVKAANQNGEIPLHLAAYQGNLTAIKYLIEHGVDPRATDSSRNNALHIVTRYGNVATIQYLLDQGVDPNSVNSAGANPLHIAVRNFSLSTVKYLMEHGADPKLTDSNGNNALLYAAQLGNLDVVEYFVEYLIEKGVDPFLVNYNGHDALENIKISKDFPERLARNWIHKNQTANLSKSFFVLSPKIQALLLQSDAIPVVIWRNWVSNHKNPTAKSTSVEADFKNLSPEQKTILLRGLVKDQRSKPAPMPLPSKMPDPLQQIYTNLKTAKASPELLTAKSLDLEGMDSEYYRIILDGARKPESVRARKFNPTADQARRILKVMVEKSTTTDRDAESMTWLLQNRAPRSTAPFLRCLSIPKKNSKPRSIKC
ncbi:ankyrin repeat domain-containing protein [Bdellovibrionota bacterium FG-1]